LFDPFGFGAYEFNFEDKGDYLVKFFFRPIVFGVDKLFFFTWMVLFAFEVAGHFYWSV
jgi:hypothetical protein